MKKKGRLIGQVAWFFFLACFCGRPVFSQTLKGIVEKRSFMGPVTKRLVEFSIYLPEGYYTGSERYPVVYHLHGLGGSHEGNHTKLVPANFERAREMGIIGPVIIVFPNGYKDSFWADSWDMSKPAETNIVAELIPYVDANFRTLGGPKFRAIQGFSMGGFGAAKFITKFPDLFVAAIVYDGALLDWTGLSFSQFLIASTIFKNDEAYFNQFSPWYQSKVNQAKLQVRLRIRMVVGALVFYNREFFSFLANLSIPVDYIETPCLHDLNCLLNAEGLGSASFLAGCFGQASLFEDNRRHPGLNPDKYKDK